MRKTHRAFVRGGMNATEAAELHESGIVAVDIVATSSDERCFVTRSEPINVFAPTMNLNEYFQAGLGLNSRFVLVDTHTGSVLSPARLQACALLGREGFRQSLPVNVKPVAWARARFNSIPYFLCESVAEMDALATSLQGDDQKVFFRGQTTDYTIQRTASVRRFLYGDDRVRETSLPSTAFRTNFDYSATEPVIEIVFGDVLFRLTGKTSRTHWVEDEIEMVCVSVSDGGIAARRSATTMALAQHYGIPTYGLDVTRSVRFAWWFATHTFDTSTGGYMPLIVDPHVPLHSRPVMYVFRSQHSVELRDLDLFATRPQAQEAVFVHGSWGLHGNVCAEDLIAILILGGDIGVCDEPLDRLFPKPSEDPVYQQLLALKLSLTEEPFRSVLAHVYEVH